MTTNDFKGKLGGHQYDLLVPSIPHYIAMQDSLVAAVVSHLKDDITWKFEYTRDVINQPKKWFKVAELGSGTGITTGRLLNALFHQLELVCIDNEEQMWDAFIRKHCGLYGTINRTSNSVLEVHGDILTRLSHGDNNSFDAVVSAFTIHNMEIETRKQVFKEAYRVLRPGGLLVECDKIATDDYVTHINDLAWQLNQLQAFDASEAPELKQEWIKHYEFDEQPGIVLKESQLEQTLSQTGFKDIKKTWRCRLEATYVAVK